MVEILGRHWVRDLADRRRHDGDDRIGGLREEERRLLRRVATHFLRVLRIVAPDADDLARKDGREEVGGREQDFVSGGRARMESARAVVTDEVLVFGDADRGGVVVGEAVDLHVRKCRMQNAECRIASLLILHFAFCILHSVIPPPAAPRDRRSATTR